MAHNNKIADRLAKRIYQSDDLTEVIEALYDLTTFALSQIRCAGCRTTFANSIAKQIVEDANRRAADIGLPVTEACKRAH